MTIDITFRTLKGGTFKLTAHPADTVLDLKKRVGEKQSIEQHVGIRLIYKGKILTDDATVESAAITTAGFVVVMPPKKSIAKPAATTPNIPPTPAVASKSTPASASTTPASTAPSASEAPATTTATENANATANAQPATSSDEGPNSADDANSLVTGAAYEQSVKQIVEMGFPETEVKRALRAAFNNPQRAVDYLFNGIPESATVPEPPAQPATTTSPANRQQTGTSPTTQGAGETERDAGTRAPPPGTPFNMFETPTQGSGGGAQGGAGSLDFLRTLPQFNLMRRLIQANPAVLPQILQQLEETNPSLLAMIEANQAEFTRLINEPLREGEDGGDDAVMEQLAQAMAGAGGPGGQPGPGQIYVTEEEHEQIVRLSELGATIGLEESHVVETWLACNRDETLAANFLVDHAEELRADTQRNNAANPQNPPDDSNDGGGPPA